MEVNAVWNLVVFAVLAAAPQFQIDAQSAAGTDATEIREAVVRAMVAGGSRVVLGGTGSDCKQCARVRVVERSSSVYSVEVEQDGRRKASRLKVHPESPLLDKARAVAVQVRLLTRPAAEDAPAPAVVQARPRPVVKSKAIQPKEPATASKEAVAIPFVPPAAEPVGFPSPASAPSSANTAAVASTARSEPRPSEEPPAASPVPPPSPPKPAPVRTFAEAAPEEPRPPKLTKAAAVVEEEEPKPRPKSEPSEVAMAKRLPPARETPSWPYVPLTIGAAAGISAAVCGVLARDRYDALADRSRSYADAVAIRNSGERLQLAAILLGGTAVVSEVIALLGFTAHPIGVTPVALAGSDGAFVGVTGALP